MLQIQHGHIGTREIEKAIEIFKNNYISDKTDEIIFDDKNIYLQKMNGYVKGQEFNDIEELISNTECFLSTFTSLEDYKDQMSDWDEDYIFSEDESDIIEELEDGNTVYVIDVAGNEYINKNKSNLILEAICDGEQFCYTLKDAWDNLHDGVNANESLIIWLLNR